MAMVIRAILFLFLVLSTPFRFFLNFSCFFKTSPLPVVWLISGVLYSFIKVAIIIITSRLVGLSRLSTSLFYNCVSVVKVFR